MKTPKFKISKVFGITATTLLIVGSFANYGHSFNISTSINNATQVIKTFFVTDDGSAPDGTNEVLSVNSGSNGRVGIWVANPTQTLHVDGNIRVNDAADLIFSNKLWNVTAGDLEINNSTDNAIILGTNSIERMRISSGGNVGIGTDNPSEKMSVSAGNIGLDNGYSLAWESSAWTMNVDTTNGFRFYTDGILRNQFDDNGNNYFGINSGNVGIGTTGPQYKLDVNGALRATSQALAPTVYTNTLRSYNNNTDINISPQWTGNTTIANGNVGIGTTTPEYDLQILWKNGKNARFEILLDPTSTSKFSTVNIENDVSWHNLQALMWGTTMGWTLFWENRADTAQLYANNSPLLIGTTQGYNLTIWTNNLQAITIDTSQNVGIGTDNPSTKLDVNGSIKANGSWNFIVLNSGIWPKLTVDGFESSGTNPLNLRVNDVTRLSITSGGNVGIGTNNPSTSHWATKTLEVHDSIAPSLRLSNDNYGFEQYITSLTNNMYIDSNAGANNIMTLEWDTGNVGIWTTSPSEALDVSGAIAIKGNPVISDNGDWVWNPITADSIWNNSGTNVYYNSGDIGIGTDNPEWKLHIKWDTNAYIWLEAGSINSDQGLIFKSPTSLNWLLTSDRSENTMRWYSYISWKNMMQLDAINGDLSLEAGNLNILTGNLGIGTDTPSEELHVVWENTTLKVEDSSSTTAIILRALNNSAILSTIWSTKPLNFGINQITKMTLDDNGNLGIGTTSPDYPLDIKATTSNKDLFRLSHPSSPTNAGFMIGFDTDGTTDDNVVSMWVEYSSVDYDVINIQRSTRNVGIGTNTPTEALDVDSDAIRIRTSQTPSTSSSTCSVWTMAWDSGYVYVCVATDTWKRASLSTW